MNKKLVMLCGAGVMALSACSLPFGANKKAKQALQELVDMGAALKSFEGHEVATKIKNGQEYYLGVYRKNEDLIRFGNGAFHEDSKGEYPFYMSTTSATVEGAAVVKAEKLGKGKFGFKVSCDPSLPWNGKYLGVYGAISSVSNKAVTSLALLDSPTQTEYKTITNYQAPVSETVSCSGVFKFYDYYEDMPACTIGCIFQNDAADELEETPKFFGTGHDQNYLDGKKNEDYISMDAKMAIDALQNCEDYDLMHLYKK